MPHPAPFGPELAERHAALAFLSLRGVGPATLGALTRAFGSLATAVSAGRELIEQHLRPEGKQSLAASPELSELRDRTLDRLAAHHADVLFRGDPGWPLALADLGDSEPVALFVRGHLRLDRRFVSVVGSRDADDYGVARARGLGARLAAAGMVTVSGGAVGIDREAHLGALVAGGTTVAIIGSGFDFPFPHENTSLFDRIASEDGAVVSEFPPSHEPKPGNFPRRNNLVAALGEATVVVRGDTQSGALLTAGDAFRLGRPLLAVPGAVDEVGSRGPHLLLRMQRAQPCCDFGDVLRAMGMLPPLGEKELARNRPPPAESRPELDLVAPRSAPVVATPVSVNAAQVLEALSSSLRHVDELVSVTRLPVRIVAAALTELEMAGLAAQHPGQRFVRR